MKVNICELNTRPRQTPASSDSLMNADFDLVSLLLAESQFQDLREYMSLAQDFVVRKQREFRKRVDDHLTVNALEGDDRDEYRNYHENDYDQLHNQFPRIVFSSTLLMSCALFEGSLVDLCKSFERVLTTPAPWNAFDRDRGITKAAAFLKSNFGIHLSNYSHWSQIVDYFKVRDCIVHADGDLSNMQPQQANRIRETVNRYGSLESSVNTRRLVVGHKFVSAVIDTLGGIWPLLETACIENEIIGPRYWP